MYISQNLLATTLIYSYISECRYNNVMSMSHYHQGRHSHHIESFYCEEFTITQGTPCRHPVATQLIQRMVNL